MELVPDYAELHCVSNFSFLRGASSARELFERARRLGYRALAITDECSLAGIVRALEASEAFGVPLIVGSEFTLEDGLKLLLLVRDAAGYAALGRLITTARRRAGKGRYRLDRDTLASLLDDDPAGRAGLFALWLPPRVPSIEQIKAALTWLRPLFPEDALYVALALHRWADDAAHRAAVLDGAARQGVPVVATGAVLMHVRARRAMQDVLTAIRLGTTVAEAAACLQPNGERHLRRREDLATLYPAECLARSVALAERCRFSLRELRYRYPSELVPTGHTPRSWLRVLTERGSAWRWPNGVPEGVRAQIEHELALIAELGYEAYFLTVHDLVRYARSRGILCQGRGSAANSAVCFCLGITEVDPARMNMLFERFISKERNEPPDIDVDFEHERREEVIQYVYAKYGRERAALAATVICYRPKSALRDVGKALGLGLDQIERITAALTWWDGLSVLDRRLEECGLDPHRPILRKLLALTAQLVGFPRHLSQHVGGFVIADAPLWHLVPIENAAMPERTVIQWDKDDLDTLGLLKVDCLALGMLSCLRRALALIDPPLTLAEIPAEDPATYAMIQRADTVGVFQIESRAQMSMLPRLKPRCFYDLVIEVAIVRPGPIQGKMVHPYLRRRAGLEPVEYPSEDLRRVFERTLGVPIFQEQVMQLAIVAAGFSPGEADQLRRSMAAWKRRGGLEHFQRRIVDGMRARGYDEAFAQQVFEQIKGFGSYGFPESHAASFALLVYASCWIKCHHPTAFACALLNAQPLGFYSPAQILQDLRRHGGEVRPVDVCRSDWDCTLEQRPGRREPALRLGLRMVRGLSAAAAERIVAARQSHPFTDVADLVARARLDRAERRCLAAADALRPLAGHRHRAQWAVAGSEPLPGLLTAASLADDAARLPVPAEATEIHADYAQLGFTLRRHPLALLRGALRARGARCIDAVLALPHGSRTRVAGLVTLRQRPSTASGTTFLTLEDETGWLNLIVWRPLAERQRPELLQSRLLAVAGELQKAEGVVHLLARRLWVWDELLGDLDARSRDFH